VRSKLNFTRAREKSGKSPHAIGEIARKRGRTPWRFALWERARAGFRFVKKRSNLVLFFGQGFCYTDIAMKKPVIITVEDDPDIRESVTAILESEGYEVRAFENGKLALDALRESPEASLILLDWMMPVMSGGEFLVARCFLPEAVAKVPVVVISAFQNIAKPTVGVKDFVKKPFKIDNLLDVVHKHCRQETCAS
jgi:CheY-like chemotaxis protein